MALEPAPLPRLKGLCILAVDDDEAGRRTTKLVLERHLCRVHTVAQGADAVQAVRTHAPDLVLLDWVMPKVSGLEVLQQLRADAELAATPVVVLSAYVDDGVRGQAQAAGVLGVLDRGDWTQLGAQLDRLLADATP